MSPVSLNPALGPSGGDAPNPRNLEEAATAFEGLLVGQLLRMAREAQESESQDGTPLREYAEEQFATQIAAAGGLGFAKTVMTSLAQPARSGKPAAI